MSKDNYFHWLWGDNILREDEPNYLVNLEHGVSIRFDYGDSYYASYEDFYGSIADVQFLGGKRPDGDTMEFLFTEAWNFLALSEGEQENRANLGDDEGF